MAFFCELTYDDISGTLKCQTLWGDELIAASSTTDKVHVTSCMICLHVRDQHLKGLVVVAKQQPSPFSQPFFFLFSYMNVCLSAVIFLKQYNIFQNKNESTLNILNKMRNVKDKLFCPQYYLFERERKIKILKKLT